MARIIDITDKLNFEEKPKLIVRDIEIEVSNKAIDVLKITPTLKKKTIDAEDIYKLYQILFSEESQKKVESLDLDFDDFSTLIMQAAMLIASAGNNEGEDQTPATT